MDDKSDLDFNLGGLVIVNEKLRNFGYILAADFSNITSSSSSCHAGSTDLPDPLSPLFPIVHRLR